MEKNVLLCCPSCSLLPLPQYLFPTLLNVFIVFIGCACCLFLHTILNFIKYIVYLKEKKSINTLDSVDFQSDSDSFNPTLWEEQRQQRMTVAFEFEDKKEDDESAGKVKVNFWPLFLLLSVRCYYSDREGIH